MNNEEKSLLKSVIDVFYEQKIKAFSIKDISNDIDPLEPFDLTSVYLELINDDRFLQIKTKREIFVSKKALTDIAVNLNYYLSSINVFRLKKKLVRKYFSSILITKIKVKEMRTIYKYLTSRNLSKQAYDKKYLVFPIASIVSKIIKKSWQLLFFEELNAEFNGDNINNEIFELKLEEIWSGIPERIIDVLKRREGLFDKAETLEEIGSSYKISRERVRQLEKIGYRKLCHPTRIKYLRGFLFNFLIKSDFNLLLEKDKFNNELRFVLKSLDAPWVIVEETEFVVIGGNDYLLSLIKEIKKDPSNANLDICCHNLDTKTDIGFSKSEVEKLSLITQKQTVETTTGLDRVYLALKNIGKPAHYSEVANKYNEMFPDYFLSDHNVHATLGRKTKEIVWIGAKGTFALSEWGYSRPLKPIHEAVMDIVEELYERTGNPVPKTMIITELYKYRTIINQNSLIMALSFNKGVVNVGRDLYVPKKELTDENVSEKKSQDDIDKAFDDFYKKDDKKIIKKIMNASESLSNKIDKALDMFKSKK